LSLAAERRRRAQTGLAAAFFFGAGVVIVLLRFPPDQYSFYPQCPIHTYLHLLCPGCGATRALAALLHGRVAAAFHFNALLIAGVLPAAAAYAALCLVRWLSREEFRWPVPRGEWASFLAYAGIAVALGFAVIRNLRG
jgi:drug/metabolite transporter (DMT)-like permease